MKSRMLCRKNTGFLFIIMLLLLATGLGRADDGTTSFEQPVPFGVAHSADGGDIQVFRKPSGGKASGALHDYQLCAVVSTEKLSGISWYRINFFDDSDREVSGYVSENEFYQLTVAGLVQVMAEPEFAAYLQRFSGLADSAAFAVSGEAVTRANPAAAADKLEETSSNSMVQTYVLNANSRKFHIPTCKSVSDMKESNRIDFTGTREDVISMGYEPCGRCRP